MKKAVNFVILVLLLCAQLTACGHGSTADVSCTQPEQTVSIQSTASSSSQQDHLNTEDSTTHTESGPGYDEAETTGTDSASDATKETEDTQLIGRYYTRAELEALDCTHMGWGAGSSEGGVRPPYALSTQPRYGKYDAWFIAPDNGKVYLTFDLGYEYKDLTNTTLDILKEKNVKAVFFVNMEYISDNQEIILRIIREGHTLANHAYHHYDMPELSIDEMVGEIMDLHNYVLGTYDYEMTLFRPPSGYYSERLLAVAQTLGYTTVQYSFAYKDWETSNQPAVDKTRDKLIDRAHSGAIFLLHTVSETNAAVLADVIDGIQAKGYTLELFDPNSL